MPARRKLNAMELRWVAAVVGDVAVLATMFSNIGATFHDGGNVAIADASIGPVPLKFVLAISSVIVVGLLYLASRRANGSNNSN